MQAKTNHFISFGGGGANILESLTKTGIKGKCTYVNEMPRPGLEARADFVQFIPPPEKIEGYGKIHHFPFSDMRIELRLPENVNRLFDLDEDFVLIACLGQYTGTKFIESLIPIFLRNKQTFKVFCSIPYQYEGDNKRALAFNVVNQFKYNPDFMYFDLEDIHTKHENLRLGDAFAFADSTLTQMISDSVSFGQHI